MNALIITAIWIGVALTVFFLAFRSSSDKDAPKEPFRGSLPGGAKIAIVLAGAFLLIGLPAAVLSKASDRLPSGAGTYTVPSSEAMIEGRDIFRSTCASCHALNAANARGVYGPDLDEVLGAPGADPKATATRVEGAIKTGGVTGKQMPVGLLSGTDAKLVSDYIAEVAGK